MNKLLILPVLFACFGFDGVEAQTTCNPLVLPNYPVGMWCRGVPNGSKPDKPLWRVERTEQYRELADPTLLVENGEYWLFPSCGGAWKSKDAANWEYVDVKLGEIGYAPTVVKHEGRFYAVGSDSPVYEAKRLEGPWKEVGRFELPAGSPPLADPMLFSDGGRLYLYWGCTPKGGIWGGVVGERGTWNGERDVLKIVDARELVKATPKENAWMRCNPADPKSDAWMEGAWMVKIGDKYALTYSASGTENATYAMGAAYSDSPLGPFVVDEDNPFFRKTEGLVCGTGHGAIAKGPDGKWRVVYCIAVGERHGFERLIGMDILNVDEAAGRILKTLPSETPRFLDGRDALWCETRKKNEDTSPASPVLHAKKHRAVPRAETHAPIPFAMPQVLRAVRIVWRDVGLDDTAGALPGPYKYRIEAKVGNEWVTAIDASANTTDLFVDYRETPRIENVEAVRLVVLGSPVGITASIYDFTAFTE